MERNEHIYEGTKTKAEYIKELSGDDTSTRNIARIVLITGVVGVLLTFGGKIMPQIIPIKDLKKHLKFLSCAIELQNLSILQRMDMGYDF